VLTVDVLVVLTNFTFTYITPCIFWPDAGAGNTILVIAVSYPTWRLDITMVSCDLLGHLVAGVAFAYGRL